MLRTIALHTVAAALLFICASAMSSEPRAFNIPPGDLAPALEALAKQTGLQLVFEPDQLKGVQTRGLSGRLSPEEAVTRLLDSTPLTIKTYSTGEILISAPRDAAKAASTGANDTAYNAAPGNRATLHLAQEESARTSNQQTFEEPAKPETVRSDSADVEEVVVTGTHIRSPLGEVTANPVFTWTHEDFERSGYNTLGEFRQMIPQLGVVSGIGGTGLTGGTITSLATQARVDFDLRGFGNNTTLILVNGRRMARGGQSIGVDAFNPDGIPLSMIDRIEVLTAGASALYGADAIGGVVNIILKKDFTGSDVTASYDNTFANDAAVRTISAKTGYRAGAFSILASGTWSDNNEQKLADRWFTRTENRGIFANSNLDSVVGGTGSIGVRFGSLPGIGKPIVAIPDNSNGGDLTVADYQNAGPVAPRFDLSPLISVINPAIRKNAMVRTAYDWSPALQLFLDLNVSEVATRFTDRPVRARNLTIPAGYAGNPFGVPVVLNKLFFDLPRSIRESINRNRGATLGLQGELPHHWNYEVAASWAQARLSDDYPNKLGTAFDPVRLAAAMNDPDPARRPLLIYDSNAGNPNPPGLVESLTHTDVFGDTSDTFDYSVQFTGPTMQLPAGPLSVAAGLEYRVDKVDFIQNPDPSFLQSGPQRSVRSAFAELQIPLFSTKNSLPLLRQLDINLAARIDDHNDFGRAETPRVGLLYRPVDWLALRGSRSEGFKAPTLYSLYAPLTPFDDFFDVFNPLFDSVRQEFVEGPVTLSFGGNPDLKPERSVTYNWGFVLDVPFVQHLSLSLDYYQIDYRDKVEDLLIFTPQLLVDSYPDRVTREPTTDGSPGVITAIDGTALNASVTRTRGYDLQLSYHRPTRWGTFSMKAGMTNPQRYEFRVAPSDATAELMFPKRISGTLTLSRQALEVSMASAYQAKYVISPSQTYTAPSKIEWTPTLSYDFGRDAQFRSAQGWWLGRVLSDTKITASFPNVFNRGPSTRDAATSFVTVYDPRLARYILTIRKQF